MLAGLLIAAAGVGLLATWTANTPYPQLLPALLCWGIGLGVLTPAVVAAAIAAAPPERSGLASGVNNTARQAGGDRDRRLRHHRRTTRSSQPLPHRPAPHRPGHHRPVPARSRLILPVAADPARPRLI